MNKTCCCDTAEEKFEGFFLGCKCLECLSAEVGRVAFAENMQQGEIGFSNVVIEPLYEDAVDF